MPAAPGVDPAPASLAPVLLDVPDRLALPEVGPLPAAPGDEPEPASLAPVLFIVPERVCPEPPSAAWAAAPRASVAAMARIVVRMSGSLGLLVSANRPPAPPFREGGPMPAERPRTRAGSSALAPKWTPVRRKRARRTKA